MTPERVAELRALAEATTPGPWGSGKLGYRHRAASPVVQCFDVHTVDLATILVVTPSIEFHDKANAEFIAAARTALPEALDEIKRLQIDLNHEAVVSDRRAQERNAALAVIDRVRSLHVTDGSETPFCRECGHALPCLTARACEGPFTQ